MVLLRRLQGFRLNIHAAPSYSPSTSATWHLEAQAEEAGDIIACATPAGDLFTYLPRRYVPSKYHWWAAPGIIYITTRYRQMLKFALAVEQIQHSKC